MYKQISIENIKTFEKKQNLKISPFTLIYGENSSGKTTLLKTFDILHNIFAEREVRTGKNISTESSSNFFMRRRGTENISAKKIHHYSSRENKKVQRIEVEINVSFHKNYKDLDLNFENLKSITRIVSDSPRFEPLSRDYWKQVKEKKFKINEHQVPIKMSLEIKYFPKKKISKVNKIILKTKNDEEIVSFRRINKNYKEIWDNREIGYISKEEKRELYGKPSRLIFSRMQRMRREIKPDYFVDQAHYSDYKIKTSSNSKFWKREYKYYKEIFSSKKEINNRYHFINLILRMMNKYQTLGYSDFSGRQTSFKAFFYYILKKFFNKNSNFTNYSKEKVEIKLMNYFEKIKEPKWHDKIEKFFIDDRKNFSSVNVFSKKHNIKLYDYYFINYLSTIEKVNLKLLEQLYQKQKNINEFSKKLSTNINKENLMRFAKQFITRPHLIKKDGFYRGMSTQATADVLLVLNLFVSEGLNKVFLEEQLTVDAFNPINPLMKSAFTYKLLKKCMVEISKTVNNLVICQPNKSEIPYDVMDEEDYSIEFWNAMEKIKKDKLFRKELSKQDEEIRNEYFLKQPKIHKNTKLKNIDKRKIYDPMEIHPDGRNFDRVIINNDSLRKELNKILKDILNLEIKVVTPKFLKKILKSPDAYKAFREAERKVPYANYYMPGMGRSRRNKFIMLRDLKYKKNFVIHGREVGKGPANILPFLAQILSDRPNLTYLIQELENNWHPKYQAKIIALLVNNLKKSDNKYFILETHSELFVLQIKKLVQKGILRPDQVSINFISRSEDGTSLVHHIPVNNQGGFEKPWPGGFFTERMEVITS